MHRSGMFSWNARLTCATVLMLFCSIVLAQEPVYNIGINQSTELDTEQADDLISWANGVKNRKLTAEELNRFKADLVKHGWPTYKSGGREAIDAAGLLLLASSDEFPLQNYLLRVLDQQVSVDIDPAAYARMTDLVFKAHGEFQIYGTILGVDGGKVQPTPKVDSAQAQLFFRDFYGLKSLKEELAEAQAEFSARRVLKDAYADLPLSMQPQGYTKPEIRKALGRMIGQDQAARANIMRIDEKEEPKAFAEAQANLKEIDSRNLVDIQKIFREVGFPTMAMVGRDGVSTAFLLVQHADEQPEFQMEALKLAKPLMERRELSKQQYAMLTDRVLVAKGKPQRYGTQLRKVGDMWGLIDVEDPAELDSRRETMAMGPVADYIRSANDH